MPVPCFPVVQVDDYESAKKLCTRIRANLAARLASSRRRNHNKQHTKRGNAASRRSVQSGEMPSLTRRSMDPPGHRRSDSTEEDGMKVVQRINSHGSTDTAYDAQRTDFSANVSTEGRRSDGTVTPALSRNSSDGCSSVVGSVISDSSRPGSTFDVSKPAEAFQEPTLPPPPPPPPPPMPTLGGGRSRSGLSEMVRGDPTIGGQGDESMEVEDGDADELEYNNYRDALVMHCMSGPLSVVKAHCLVTVALKLMQECKKSCLVVDNGLGEEPGLVTKRDFLKAMKRHNMRGVQVGRLQSRPIHSIGVGDRVRDAAKLMNKLQVRPTVPQHPKNSCPHIWNASTLLYDRSRWARVACLNVNTHLHGMPCCIVAQTHFVLHVPRATKC